MLGPVEAVECELFRARIEKEYPVVLLVRERYPPYCPEQNFGSVALKCASRRQNASSAIFGSLLAFASDIVLRCSSLSLTLSR